MFRQLECFIQICEEGSFARAAESLLISQPALSQQIRYIEAEFGAAVFKRAGRGVKLTAAGQILYEKARSVMELIDESKTETYELNYPRANQLSLSIGISPFDCPYLMPLFLKFHKQNPAIALHFVNIENGYGDLRNRFIDIAFSDCSELYKELYAVHVYKEEQALIVYADHPWADRTAISLHELEHIDSDVFVSDTNTEELMQTSGFETAKPAQTKFQSTSSTIVLYMVMQKMGVAILPISFLESSACSKVKVIRFLDPIPAREVKLIVQKDRFIEPAIQNFISYFLEPAKSLSM